MFSHKNAQKAQSHDAFLLLGLYLVRGFPVSTLVKTVNESAQRFIG
jgi:hypothetical protein